MRHSFRRALCMLFLFTGMMIWIIGCGLPSSVLTVSEEIAEIYRAYPLLEGKEAEQATVRRVIDGDTFETTSGQRVRLIGIDTPEVHGKSEPYGKEASAFSKQHLTERKVWMFRDVSDTDRYGRLLRYIFLQGDTDMFNERLVAEGYAQPYTYPPDVLFAERFVDAALKARAEQKGLWSMHDTNKEAAEHRGHGSPACDEPTIKGNINSKGEKIYHQPDSRYYKQTIEEQMFCTVEEAVAAGFRAPKSP